VLRRDFIKPEVSQVSLNQQSSPVSIVFGGFGLGGKVSLDTRYMPAGGIPSATQAASVFAIARALQLTAVPVTSLSSAPAYQQAIGTAAATDGRGVMIRTG
jgi:hypothetical protein